MMPSPHGAGARVPIHSTLPLAGRRHHKPRCLATPREEVRLRIRSAAAALLALVASAPALAQEAPPGALPDGFTAPGAATPSPAYIPPIDTPAPLAAPSGPQPQGSFQGLPPVSFGPAPDSGRDVVEAPSRRRSGWNLDVGFGTELPISVGGLVTAEVPGRVLFQVGLGVLPGGYVNAIDGFLTAVKAYDQSVSKVVKGSLGNSFVLKASMGWRPFPSAGFEMLGGYTLMTMGGSAAASDVIDAVLAQGATGVALPAGLGAEVPLAATMHNVHATLGWRWLLADDHLVIRASLSYIQCVAASVGVKLDALGAQAASYESTVNGALNDQLQPFFTKYVKAPTLGLSAAYRF